jgi:hypothetical protein
MRWLQPDQDKGGLADVRYDDTPSLLLIADTDPRRATRAAADAGFRLLGPIALPQAEPAIAHVAADAIVVHVGDAYLDPLGSLLRRLDEAAVGCRVLVVGCAARLGRMAESFPKLCLLATGDAVGLSETLRAAAKPEDPCFCDAKNTEAPRLQKLSEEVGRIANILATLSEDEKEEANAGRGPRVDAGLVRSIIRARRLRDHYFRGALFADPAWDMLLDLFAARLEERRVAVSSLCIAAAVPATTALRWIKSLTDQRLFVRVADPQDGRRVFIELSDEAAAGLESYLRAAQRISNIIL